MKIILSLFNFILFLISSCPFIGKNNFCLLFKIDFMLQKIVLRSNSAMIFLKTCFFLKKNQNLFLIHTAKLDPKSSYGHCTSQHMKIIFLTK